MGWRPPLIGIEDCIEAIVAYAYLPLSLQRPAALSAPKAPSFHLHFRDLVVCKQQHAVVRMRAVWGFNLQDVCHVFLL